MKVLSLNLHCHKEEHEEEKLFRIAEYILREDIDVCLFQEVCQDKNNPIVVDNIRTDNNGYRLMLQTGYHFVFRDFKLGFGIYEEGLGVLSKHPIGDVELINLTNTKSYYDWFRRCALRCTILNHQFINVHLGWSLETESFFEQVDRLKEYFYDKTILAGDFNYPDHTPEINEIKKYLMSASDDFHIDPKENPTFHMELDSKLKSDNRMIDFIFHSKDLVLKKYQIKFNQKHEYVSDHSMLEIEL